VCVGALIYSCNFGVLPLLLLFSVVAVAVIVGVVAVVVVVVVIVVAVACVSGRACTWAYSGVVVLLALLTRVGASYM